MCWQICTAQGFIQGRDDLQELWLWSDDMTTGTMINYARVSGWTTSTVGSLDDLSDVVIAGSSAGDVLAHSGTNWTNTDISGLYLDQDGDTATGLLEVSLASPAANAVGFRLKTSDDSSRWSVDEDGDVLQDGQVYWGGYTGTNASSGGRLFNFALYTHRLTTSIASGISLAQWIGHGSSSAANHEIAAEIRMLGDGTWAANDSPGRIEFYTTPAGSDVQTKKMTISSAGVVTPGTTGQDFGSTSLRWDGFFGGVNVATAAGAGSETMLVMANADASASGAASWEIRHADDGSWDLFNVTSGTAPFSVDDAGRISSASGSFYGTNGELIKLGVTDGEIDLEFNAGPEGARFKYTTGLITLSTYGSNDLTIDPDGGDTVIDGTLSGNGLWRVDNGAAGSAGVATGAGDLYVEDAIEADGSIYGATLAAGRAMGVSVGISVFLGATESYSITPASANTYALGSASVPYLEASATTVQTNTIKNGLGSQTGLSINSAGEVALPHIPGASVYAGSSTNQSFATATPEQVTFDTERSDTGADFASNSFTAPITGWYDVSASIRWPVNGTGSRGIAIYVNGSAVHANSTVASASVNTTSYISASVYVTAGHTITIWGTQESGGDLVLDDTYAYNVWATFLFEG